MNEKLKPCPFCGSEAVLNHLSNIYADVYVVTCCGEKTGDCPALAMDGFDEEREQAIKAWNTRTPPEYKYTTFEDWWDNTILSSSQLGKAQARAAFTAARELKEKS